MRHENAMMKLNLLDGAELQRLPVQIHTSAFTSDAI